MTAGADRWIRWTTIGCVALLALIAGTLSYLHMHLLVELHGQPGWVVALTPLSVDGMIVAASTTLLAGLRSGGKGGVLPGALLVAGSVASLARQCRGRLADIDRPGDRGLAIIRAHRPTPGSVTGKCSAGPVTILASTPAGRHTLIANDPGGRHAQATITVS